MDTDGSVTPLVSLAGSVSIEVTDASAVELCDNEAACENNSLAQLLKPGLVAALGVGDEQLVVTAVRETVAASSSLRARALQAQTGVVY